MEQAGEWGAETWSCCAGVEGFELLLLGSPQSFSCYVLVIRGDNTPMVQSVVWSAPREANVRGSVQQTRKSQITDKE